MSIIKMMVKNIITVLLLSTPPFKKRISPTPRTLSCIKRSSVRFWISFVSCNYILALKKNQKHLWEDARDAFTLKGLSKAEYQTEEVDHGRVEKRIYTAILASSVLLDVAERWSSLESLVRIERTIYNKAIQEERPEIQSYITSLVSGDVERIAGCIRRHWSIENQLHWHLDVSFGEDHCRARREYAPQNLNVLRKIALAIIKSYKDRLSVKKRMFKAAMNTEYLKSILKF